MLSGQLKKQRGLTKILRSSQNEATETKSSDGTINTLIAAAVTFKPADNVLINGDSVSILMPTKVEGYIWDTWENQARTFPNNEVGLKEFLTAIMQASVDIGNRINKYDNGVGTVQTFTSAGITIIQIIQTTVAAVLLVSGTEDAALQISLSTVMSALSYLSDELSAAVTSEKNAAISLQPVILDLEDSQTTVAPPHTTSDAASKPPSGIRGGITGLLIHSATEASATPAANPTEPTSVVPVSGKVLINGADIKVSLPTKKTSKSLTPWTEVLTDFPNNPAGFSSLKATLFARKAQLDNETAYYEKTTTFIQSLTSLGTTVIGLVQSAVVGTQALNPTSLKIFQIAISSLNGVLAVGAKFASSTATKLRDNTVSYSGDVAEALAAQLKR
ncbi:MAG: hypothetical protein V4501_04680 [Pseudomonadota bacterium]